MSKRVIDLSKYHKGGSMVMSGRPKGEELRLVLELDKADNTADAVMIIVPEEVVSLNSSFFLGLFAKSVERLGPVGFDEKYQFECNSIVRADIEAGKRQALIKTNPLPCGAR